MLLPKSLTFASFVLQFLLLTIVFMCQVHASTIANRTACSNGDTPPKSRVDTTARLAAFRAAMKAGNLESGTLSAFIVGSADAHNSEYPSDFDKRRGYISGFSGSAGTAVITETKAALWTDSRYFLEAEDALDCNWILMRDRLPGTPSISAWLNSELTGSGEKVGVDKTLVTYTYFDSMKEGMSKLTNRLVLTPINGADNPVDKSWTSGRPQQPTQPINALKMEYAGKSWQDKIADLRAEMVNKKASAFVVTSLDETAWLFNLRGSDIAFNPFFLSYAIVEPERIRLYILAKDKRLGAAPTDAGSDQTLAQHLATSRTGTCSGGAVCVEVVDYNQGQLEADLRALSTRGVKVWMPNTKANYAVYEAVSEENRVLKNSPIAVWKSIKNEVERDGFRAASTRDSLVLVKFLAFMEKEIADNNQWSEMTAAAELLKRREAADHNRGLSFGTISSFGPNGAVIHYLPSQKTDMVITDDNMYLLDSGGQYLDGTTDVTRTMHYGNPTDYQKECYTRVLASTINLASVHWPAGLYGRQLDAFARFQLWDAGLNYLHGTGHGVGAYLSVHEGPGFIGETIRNIPTDYPLTPYQFFSDEPGYYEDGQFGVRLETLVMVTPYTPKYQNKIPGQSFLHFRPVTFVPFETKLMDMSLLTRRQVEWLNDYNSQIRSVILPLLLTDDQLAKDWVESRTRPISFHATADYAGQGAQNIHSSSTVVFFATAICTMFTLLRERFMF